jgi:predicted nuclease of restriction endonuclease-like (RecB) superfamily
MKYTQLLKAIDATSQHLVGRAAAAVNQALVIRNWLIGACIVEFEQHGEDRAKYGARLLEALASDLGARAVRGCSADMLERMRQLYQEYPQLKSCISAPAVRKFFSKSVLPGGSRISAPPVRKSHRSPPILPAAALLRFSWTHLIEFLNIRDPWKRAFYENECLKGNWSKRQLQRQIGSLLFERTGLSKDKAAVIRRANRQESPAPVVALIRDPYVLEFTGLAERAEYAESDLERALLDHLQQFLLELGTGFCFEARQKRITVGNEHDYIDLVFYHRRLRCHVLVEMKTRPFTHGDAGQMNFYLNWWKKHGMEKGDQLPVGILLCTDRDRTKVEFATAGMDNKLFVSRYLVALPSAKQLQEFIERDREQIEARIRGGR